MNKLDNQYTDLLQDILDNGVTKGDRTGTGTLSVFGRQIRHKMSDGFPLLTTKKMAWKSVVTELLWFLRGDTNIKFLVDNDCHIWDGDVYKNYAKLLTRDFQGPHYNQKQFIDLIKSNSAFAKDFGELGPVYGKQWRSWGDEFSLHIGLERDGSQDKINFKQGIDQISCLINDLKTNPDSRRLIVNSWNVGQLSEMVLPPCHYGFQVYTRELTFNARYILGKYQPYNIEGKVEYEEGLDYITQEQFESFHHKEMDKLNIPTRAISLMWNQRSVDTFLGLPFNIASYGLLLEIIAKAVNMVPDELIGNLGDVHLYSNHIEQAKEQIGRELSFNERVVLANKPEMINDKYYTDDAISELTQLLDEMNITKRTREPYPLPTLKHMKTDDFYKSLSEDVSLVTHLDNTDFTIENYQSHPTIKAPLSN